MDNHDKMPRKRTPLAQMQARLQMLQEERASWDASYREIASIFAPQAGYFYAQGVAREQNRGRRKDRKNQNNTTVMAALDCASGFHVGMSSPSKTWFLNKVKESLMKAGHVRRWLDEFTDAQRSVLAASNAYPVLWGLYFERAVFGTCVALVDKNIRDRDGRFVPELSHVINLTPLTAGTYCLAADDRGQVDTIYREFHMTVEQCVIKFGIDNVSQAVKNLWDQGSLDKYVPVVHVIEPRTARDLRNPTAQDMPWNSSYFEHGCDEDKILRPSGYKRFPALVSRWQTFAEDVYGRGPGFVALGDGNGLQHSEINQARVIALKGNPPLQVPTSMKSSGRDFLPGGLSFYDGTGPNSGVRTAFEVNLDLSHLAKNIERQEFRVLRAFFSDTFRAILNDSRSGTTKYEVQQRHEEQLQAVGPVVERVENDILRPLLDVTADALFEYDEQREAIGLERYLTEPPEELDEEDTTPEFVGALSQAVRAAAAGRLDRFFGMVGAVAAVAPDALDKVDVDELVEEYGRAIVVPAAVLRDAETTSAIRRSRAQAQASAAQAEAAKSAAAADKSMAEAESIRASSGISAPGTDVAGALSVMGGA